MTNPARRIIRRIRRFFREIGPIRHSVELGRAPRRDEVYSEICSQFARDGVAHLVGGSVDGVVPRLHVRRDDGQAAVDAIGMVLGRVTDRSRVSVLLPPSTRPIRDLDDVDISTLDMIDLRVTERESRSRTDEYHWYGTIEVDFWAGDPVSFKGDRWAKAPRFNSVCTAMHWDTLDRAMTAEGIRSLEDWEGSNDLYQRDFPIDVVYTWVDDKDPEWREIKARYVPDDDGEGSETRKNHKERFNNRDELMYSLRSLEMFAPFVRNIYIVTMGQTPSWLDTDHPQIHMVDHRDIYPEGSTLPTFNSSSIETQLHHIDGLAEHFLYFNDDVFLGKKCSWSDFFMANGVAKFALADHSIASKGITDSMEEYLVADRNAIDLFRAELGVTLHLPLAHVPHAAHRSTLYELEQRFPAEFMACRDGRFRSIRDLRPIAFMGHHYGFHRRTAIPSPISHRYLALWKPAIASQFDEVLRSRSYHTFCINDVGLTPEREADVNALVGTFLNRYFPYPSRFERSGRNSEADSPHATPAGLQPSDSS